MTSFNSQKSDRGGGSRIGPIFVTVTLCLSWNASTMGQAKVDFAREIRPILAEACFECHGPDERGRKGDLRLDSRSGVFGARGGPGVVVAGDPGESELIARIDSDDPDEVMPPTKSRRRLTRTQVDLLRRWVAEGAPWTDHWSFSAVSRPQIPPVGTSGWCRNSIDRFILSRLERAGLGPSPEASRATLIRRLSLDLLGLPPTIEEVEHFLADGRIDAYERLVDRLLASPQFGERWARSWLDLVRYADSDGYEDDRSRPDAWRFRDWVIDAFNRDLPFDRFTVEQLAGDLLSDGSSGRRIAAGFHRMAMFNRTAVGRDNEEEFRVKTAKDRASTTATVWLGLTFGCAECHSHKYDPISQRDYYRFYAFFDNLVDAEAPAPPLIGEHLRAYLEAVREFEDGQAQARSRLEAYETATLPTRLLAWEGSVNPADLPPDIASIRAVPRNLRTVPQASRIREYFRSIDPDYGRLKADVLDGEMLANNRPAPPSSKALTVADNPRPRRTFVHLRGDFLSPGEEVEPGTPSFLPPLRGRSTVPDRNDLARWLVDPSNPLPARVAANTAWQHLFGRGLVPTPENFGLQGQPPSHPELLDWLAAELVASGWSRKALIRTIVTSATYRQSSLRRPDLSGADPENLLLARQNRFRVDAEVVRDLGLSVGRILNRSMGGPSVQPALPSSLIERPEFRSERLMAPSRGAERHRRGVYVNVQRTFLYPMFRDFDVADPGAACPRRERSNTPLQALSLLNDPSVAECARGLGVNMARGCSGTTVDRVRHAFRACLARSPDGQESDVLGRLHAAHRDLYLKDPEKAAVLLGDEPLPPGIESSEAAACVAVARVIMNLDEFVTRE